MPGLHPPRPTPQPHRALDLVRRHRTRNPEPAHPRRHRTRVAEDGEQALALSRSWAAQVLVLMLTCPASGHFAPVARFALAGVPAFMCSADASAEDVQRAREAGFVAYWTKPIDIGSVMRDLDGLAALS
jgi:CheY-like chemotaxis protein